MDSSEKKRNAAKASLEFIEPGTVLGIGTGSTVNELIAILPGVRDKIDAVVSSSKASTELLDQQGFEAPMLHEAGDVDLFIHGADDANHRLQRVKRRRGAPTL